MAVKQEILLNITPQETRVAVIENGVVQELHIERALALGLVGNIYKGKVTRVLPGMQAAFVDIGLSKNGFLHVQDVVRSDPAFAKEYEQKSPLIQELVHEGQSLWVQVFKDAIGTKGARLTTELSLPSRNLVYMPNGQGIGLSLKLEDKAYRQHRHDHLQGLLDLQQLKGGFIVRTAAESASDADIVNDLNFLTRLWSYLQKEMQTTSPASLLHEDMTLAMRAMRDLVNDNVDKICIDSKETYDKALSFAQQFTPEVTEKIEYYPGEQPLFSLYAVEQEIQNALKRKVTLKSGGYLIIDQTEAMTTIDVNTGSYVGRHNQQDTLFKTNLQATSVIAHQIRLRNLGGIIIVDFIDMSNNSHKKQVLKALETAISKDRTKTLITEMSPLGLVEITRKRTRESLERVLCEDCPTCQGRGTVKTAQTICYQILREILREHRQFKAQSYTVMAAPVIIDLLLDDEASSLADLQEFIDRDISLKVDRSFQQEQYDIVLM